MGKTPRNLLVKYGVIERNALKRNDDCGVDLVSEVDGTLFLIQCKRGYDKGLNAGHLTGFFMFMTNCCRTSSVKGIVYHTTSKISRNVTAIINRNVLILNKKHMIQQL